MRDAIGGSPWETQPPEHEEYVGSARLCHIPFLPLIQRMIERVINAFYALPAHGLACSVTLTLMLADDAAMLAILFC